MGRLPRKKNVPEENPQKEERLGSTPNGELVAALKIAFREAMGLEEGETFRDVLTEAVREGTKSLASKIDSLGESLGTKIDSLGNKIDNLGESLGTKIDRIPDRIVEELYGNQTVRWGQLILGI
ncbi:MAG: hypothetical protein GXO29_07815, partial [Thermotogae bacterium]|nr:hypothetical protein [Thermotogota bacterium]